MDGVGYMVGGHPRGRHRHRQLPRSTRRAASSAGPRIWSSGRRPTPRFAQRHRRASLRRHGRQAAGGNFILKRGRGTDPKKQAQIEVFLGGGRFLTVTDDPLFEGDVPLADIAASSTSLCAERDARDGGRAEPRARASWTMASPRRGWTDCRRCGVAVAAARPRAERAHRSTASSLTAAATSTPSCAS